MGDAPGAYFVRTAARSDLEAIRALLAETWHHTYDGIYGAERVTEITDDWHAMPRLEARLHQPNSEFLVADSGEDLDGVAFAASIDDGKTVMLRQLYVKPSHQGRGIGGALLSEVEASFPQAHRVRLEVEEANQPALRFYEARGFSRAGQTGNCGGDTQDIPALIYEKAL